MGRGGRKSLRRRRRPLPGRRSSGRSSTWLLFFYEVVTAENFGAVEKQAERGELVLGMERD